MATKNESRQVFETLCRALDNNDWKYDRDDEELVATLGFRGEDLPMELTLRVDEEHMLIMILSKLPFEIPEDKRIDISLAVSAANWGMVNGSFDYSIAKGALIYRVANSYRDSLIGVDAIDYMIGIVLGAVENYNDKFFMISKGLLSIEKFIEEEQQ